MNIEVILQILQFLFPPSCIAVFWTWMKNKENRKATQARERNDTYKQMYDNLSETLLDLQNENITLYKAVRELNRTLQKATACLHYDICPIRAELQKSSGSVGTSGGSVRQYRRKKGDRMVRADPVQFDQPENTA